MTDRSDSWLISALWWVWRVVCARWFLENAGETEHPDGGRNYIVQQRFVVRLVKHPAFQVAVIDAIAFLSVK